MFEKPKIGQELLDVPMGDMIREMAFAIAEAQMRLDENSIDVAQMMGGLQAITDEDTGDVLFQDSRVFFGKEKIYLNQAVELYNNSTDPSFKNEIYNAGSAFFVNDTTHIVSSKGTKYDEVYKVSGKYYRFDGYDIDGITPIYREVSEASVTKIKIKTGVTDTNQFILIPNRLSMLELGFSPTFYQFVDTIIEVKISIKYTQSGEKTSSSSSGGSAIARRHSGLRGLFFGGRRTKAVSTSQVNASYSQKYSYSAEGSSLLRTKLVPIPPPAILEERVRQQMDLLNEGSLPVVTKTT